MEKLYADHLRRLARDEGPDAQSARRELDAAGLTYTKDIKRQNRIVNSANEPNLSNEQRNARLASAGLLPDMFLPVKKVVHRNPTPSAAGKAALQRARQKKTTTTTAPTRHVTNPNYKPRT
jgi:hypothetical protein